MRKIKEVLRLKFEAQLSHEKIAAATGMSKGAVTNTVQRAVQKGLSWPLPADLDESQLELRAARVDSLYLHVFDARPAGDILGIVVPGSVMFDFAAARLRWRVG